jgi:tRNA(Arg) A34 adenosine deaminase TadA
MKKSLLDSALRIAIKEHPSHPEYSRYAHWSFIIQNNKIIEWATNKKDGVPPITMGYHRRINNGLPKLHSEFVAYNKAKGILLKDSKWHVINIRLNKDGLFRSSAPCSCCYNFIKTLGCNKCFFTTDYGWDKVIL